MDKARPSYELAAGTHLVTTKPGALTFVSIVGAAADVTVSCYDVNAAADIATTNKIAAFKIDVSAAGMQGGMSFGIPLSFAEGLVVVVAGAGGLAYVGYTKG
jgi:hypothetical protein